MQMEEIFKKNCKRFQTYKYDNELASGIAYSVLKDSGCSKRTAIVYFVYNYMQNFLAKRYCKHDASIKYNGPDRYKVLKTLHDSNFIRLGWEYNDSMNIVEFRKI